MTKYGILKQKLTAILGKKLVKNTNVVEACSGKGEGMKRRDYFVKGFIICIIWAVLLAACVATWWFVKESASGQSKQQKQGEREWSFTSAVSKEDCHLCDNTTYAQSMEDNLGIILISSGELVHVAINRYDTSGQLVEQPSGFMSNETIELMGDFKMSLMVNMDRGYARARIVPEKEVGAELSKTAEHYCADCLATLFKDADPEECYGIGVVHFATGEVRLLDSRIRGFMLGDYYVSCNVYKEEGKDDEVEILMFYCPERFVE